MNHPARFQPLTSSHSHLAPVAAAPVTRRGFLELAGLGAAAWLAGGPRLGQTAETEKKLIVHGQRPLNAEPALADLLHDWITPVKYFYVRSHAAEVPALDPSQFTLTVEGMVNKPLKLRLAQIEGMFPQRTVTATLTCAGNRRNEFARIKPASGVQWGAAAIGNASWSGAALADVLRQAGLAAGARHVWFEGVDQIDHKGHKITFGGSIPLEKALSSDNDAPALIATRMNGQPLAPEHGFPMRTLVPGYIGARSVKWLGKIVVSDRPSPNHYLADAYKLITEETPEQLKAAEAIQQFPLNAAICLPAAGAKLKPGKLKVAGYALPPGAADRTVARVEVSSDGGRTWQAARFARPPQPFCWQLWEAEVAVSGQTDRLLARATDSTGKTQPKEVAWNLKGYLYNAWHEAPVTVN